MKSFKRLGIDPLAVYGTVFVKCPVPDTDDSAPECRARVLEELAIVQPRIVVVMGEEALEELNELRSAAGGAGRAARPGRSRSSRPPATRSTCPTSTPRSTTRRPSAAFWERLPRARRLVRGLPAVLGCPVMDAGPRRRQPDGGVRRAARARSAARGGGRVRVHPARAGHARTASPGRRTCSPAARRPRSTWTAMVERLRGTGLPVKEAKVGDPDALAAVQDACNFGELRRGDRLDPAAARLEVAQARPAAQGRARHRPAGAPRGGVAA